MERLNFDIDEIITADMRKELVIEYGKDLGLYKPEPVPAIPPVLRSFRSLPDLVTAANPDVMKFWFDWHYQVQHAENRNASKLAGLCEAIVWAVKLIKEDKSGEAKRAFGLLMTVLKGDYQTKHFPASYSERRAWVKAHTVNLKACPAIWRNYPDER